MAELVVTNLSASADDKKLVDLVSFSLHSGELLVLLGPNGAGKSSLLKAMLGLIPVESGAVLLDVQPLDKMDRLARARRIAWLAQRSDIAWPISVADMVALGRYAWGGRLDRLSADDQQAIERAMQQADCAHLANRSSAHLSGGELARVDLARMLATNAEFLLADEPVSALDPAVQLAMMRRFRDLADKGQGILLILHDMALAARFADRILWMKEARLIADQPPQPESMVALGETVFGVRIEPVVRDDHWHPVISGESDDETKKFPD